MRNATRTDLAGLACLAVALMLAGCTSAVPPDAAPRDTEPEPTPGTERTPGTTFRDCATCPPMVVVPAGSYTMGSPPTEAARDADETRRTVTIDEPFAVGMYEVTFAQWDACVDAGGCGGHRPDESGGSGRQPVVGVSWHDAQAYVAWLSGQTEENYRLLTEAEWEYVARATTTTPFHTGATISTDQANYDGRVQCLAEQ